MLVKNTVVHYLHQTILKQLLIKKINEMLKFTWTKTTKLEVFFIVSSLTNVIKWNPLVLPWQLQCSLPFHHAQVFFRVIFIGSAFCVDKINHGCVQCSNMWMNSEELQYSNVLPPIVLSLAVLWEWITLMSSVNQHIPKLNPWWGDPMG